MNPRLLFPLFFLVCLAACSPVLPIENPFEAGRSALPPEETGSAERLLKIVVIDVGQGDATLVTGPSGRAWLIDAGPEGAGLSSVLPALEKEGVERLDGMIATHYDADHIGGFAEVLRGEDQEQETDDDWIPAFGLYDRGDSTEKDTPVYQDYLAAVSIHRRTTDPGMVFDLGGGATAAVVVVNGRYADGRAVHLNPDEENEASIGLLIQYGDFEYFTAGDLTGGGAPGGYETKDLETFAGEIVGDIDILHVGHHGSSSSTNETFLEEIKPEAAVISVGRDNDYGHPTETVINRLEAIGADIYRTDLMGTLEIQTDGAGFEILTPSPFPP